MAVFDASRVIEDGGELPPRSEIFEFHLAEETQLVGGLIDRIVVTDNERRRVNELASRLVKGVRQCGQGHGGIDAFMKEYGFSNEEGVILMCLAEALLRIPDTETADALIADKIGSGRWADHLGNSESLFVNASTWGLLLTGKIVKLATPQDRQGLSRLFGALLRRSGEPVIRNALRHAMRVMADQFVLGRTIQEALTRARPLADAGCRFSFDMLGEAAMTERDALRYFDRYNEALHAVGADAGPLVDPSLDAIFGRPSISVKLSAIHPRFEPGKENQLREELVPRLLQLVADARVLGLGVTIDAEEQDRLDLTLWLFGMLCARSELAGWNGLGLAIQAYGKRAIPALRWLRKLARATGRRLPVRLVKGAYWDSEIKWAQEQGLADYPVLTRKLHTDVSYLACLRLLLGDSSAFYPQFATHNAHTLASAAIGGQERDFEFQRLHGMGEALYEQLVRANVTARPCRIYAPVGGHEDLLAYLVRRLLENGANTSFVNRLTDDALPIADIVSDPIAAVDFERDSGSAKARLMLPRPPALFGPTRRNSLGLALSEPMVRNPVLDGMASTLEECLEAGPIVNGEVGLPPNDIANVVYCPHDRRERLGRVRQATQADVELAFDSAHAASRSWDQRGGEERAVILERVADLYERRRDRLMAVIVREAGKTLANALGDVREAVDFLRYYANEARRLFADSTDLPGPTGETNVLSLCGRGPFVCISPWNFPLAIFTGQIAGALAAGNTVLAKPAAQTPLTAFAAVQLFHEAGVPGDVLHLLPGDGTVGALLVADARSRGVAFTGSNETAWSIQKALTDRRDEIVPFIAETGGVNAVIVDSSALLEQVTRDVIFSAFDSAGQRCSAARVLFVQDDIADDLIAMLVGASEMLRIGDPIEFGTDIGPVIDTDAQDRLEAHKARLGRTAKCFVDIELPRQCDVGTFVSPAIYEIAAMSELEQEVFGPILHVIRYSQGHLDRVSQAINRAGYGLTLGVHSRIEKTVNKISAQVRMGNIYVNRNQIGAVVGVQPFGGVGLSGSGPKAGGPNYLTRFAMERVVTTDITATGGNIQLLNLTDKTSNAHHMQETRDRPNTSQTSNTTNTPVEAATD
ncbi:MAG: bifunctional proline dehydrogenase/L-glutamate gamma-semialdehyde dehydrogenase PutA [Hyphomicrobiaceae bacterium]